jgi:hypothetical protein
VIIVRIIKIILLLLGDVFYCFIETANKNHGTNKNDATTKARQQRKDAASFGDGHHTRHQAPYVGAEGRQCPRRQNSVMIVPSHSQGLLLVKTTTVTCGVGTNIQHSSTTIQHAG